MKKHSTRTVALQRAAAVPGVHLLLTVQTAASQLGLSVWTVRLWAYNGKIASHKLGSRLMVSQTELDRIVRSSERPRITEVGS